MKLTEMSLFGLARLCHRAEDTGDDFLLNDVMSEVERRNAADVYTSPYTGDTYPTGNVYREFNSHYMSEMAERAAKRRVSQ